MVPGTSSLTQDLVRAINGEYSAIACYAKLAEKAPNHEEKKRIMEIRQDEVRHYHIFSQIFTEITGVNPNPQITEKCPATYREGLKSSFKDEQETVDFYLDVAEKTRDLFIKEQFKRAASDEQNHAVWFLWLLNK
ncbi:MULTISPECIES: ferritin-like domain-containing protein [unclassified Dehalobacter]|uniref:ferritin-like domain-containing protein n=1 Tax=unclassified Dehalobacter TaxID=2635733 RepID=UPI000E6CBA23|nr:MULTISPECIES: ferritin-like domain-containing protein [unclassified Dehalobacter]RJE48036.1 rubrerythrin family protein [Dehalobacter sp. MCB1]TCX50555.1 rubrerythrin family protein [Dehalobacter sp. 14DCB1]TCX52201.1 rubrerythrin family protein [Dehalobacter sp. 12DCB1]